MLKAHHYTIVSNPGSHLSVLAFDQGEPEEDISILCVQRSDEPEALGKLSRIMAFYALLDAELYDRATLGDFESETLTSEQIQAQVARMLTEPEVLEALGQCAPETLQRKEGEA